MNYNLCLCFTPSLCNLDRFVNCEKLLILKGFTPLLFSQSSCKLK